MVDFECKELRRHRTSKAWGARTLIALGRMLPSGNESNRGELPESDDKESEPDGHLAFGALFRHATESPRRADFLSASARRTVVEPLLPHPPLTGAKASGLEFTSRACCSGLRSKTPFPFQSVAKIFPATLKSGCPMWLLSLAPWKLRAIRLKSSGVIVVIWPRL